LGEILEKKIHFWHLIRFKLFLCFGLPLLFFALVVGAFLNDSVRKMVPTFFLVLSVTYIIISALLVYLFTRPIKQLQEQAVRLYNGDYAKKVSADGVDELSQFGQIFNELATRIEKTQRAAELERSRLNSVLKHMTDGVIATDRKGNIVIINEMALSQLGIQEKDRATAFTKMLSRL
jgi:two-component system sensor histidine kinase VicK